MNLLLSDRIEALLQFVTTLKPDLKSKEIRIYARLNTNECIKTEFNMKYPFDFNYSLQHLLKQIQRTLNVDQKLQRLFISDNGQELNSENMIFIFNESKKINLVTSFGEDFIENIEETSYHHLFDGKTYPFMNENTKQQILSIQQKRNSNIYGYKDTVIRTYNALKQTLDNNNKLPVGLTADYIDDINIINGAIKEAEDIFTKLSRTKCSESNKINYNLTNFHFYINTPFYVRKNDSWPMFQFNDKNVINICKCIQIAAKKLLNQSVENVNDIKRLNIIVRQYKYGDFLGFHCDGIMFDENICGIVLKNECPSNGLMLSHYKLKQHMIDESKNGLCWLLNDCARWEYQHGLYIPTKDVKNDKKYARISISFRWYSSDDVIPIYNKENDDLIV